MIKLDYQIKSEVNHLLNRLLVKNLDGTIYFRSTIKEDDLKDLPVNLISLQVLINLLIGYEGLDITTNIEEFTQQISLILWDMPILEKGEVEYLYIEQDIKLNELVIKHKRPGVLIDEKVYGELTLLQMAQINYLLASTFKFKTNFTCCSWAIEFKDNEVSCKFWPKEN